MSIEEQMSFIDNIKKQHDDYIKEVENANSISLFVSVKSYDYNYLRDLMIRGFRGLAKYTREPILGIEKDFDFSSPYGAKSIKIRPYYSETRLSDIDDVKDIAEHVAITIYGTHSRDIMLALEGQFGISAMFDIRTKNPIKDIEGNDIEIIEMLFHEGLTNILIPTIRFGITDSNNKLISTDIKEFTEITLKKDTFKNIDYNFDNVKNTLKELSFVKNIEFVTNDSKMLSVEISERTHFLNGDGYSVIKHQIDRYKKASNLKTVSFKVFLNNNLYDINGNRINEVVFDGKDANIIEYYTGYKNKKVTTIK